jgi:hypothetical protein
MGARLVSQEKGDTRYGGVSCISRKRETRVMEARLVSQEKGDTLWGHVSLLLHMIKKNVNRLVSTPCFLRQHANGRLHTCTHVCKWPLRMLDHEAQRGAHAI